MKRCIGCGRAVRHADQLVAGLCYASIVTRDADMRCRNRFVWFLRELGIIIPLTIVALREAVATPMFDAWLEVRS